MLKDTVEIDISYNETTQQWEVSDNGQTFSTEYFQKKEDAEGIADLREWHYRELGFLTEISVWQY